MKKSELKQIIRESIKELVLNEAIPCQCHYGSGGHAFPMTCYEYGPQGVCCNHFYVKHTMCCSQALGGIGHNPHPMCNDMHCGNLQNTTCFDVGGHIGEPGGGYGGDPDSEDFLSRDDLDIPKNTLTFVDAKKRVKSKMPQVGYDRENIKFDRPEKDEKNIRKTYS